MPRSACVSADDFFYKTEITTKGSILFPLKVAFSEKEIQLFLCQS